MNNKLKAIANLINSQWKVIADVGCDIAYLSFYNYTNHLHHFFYNIDNKEGPLKLAKQLHQKVANDAIFICSEGLTYLKTNNINVDCCVIAGVGGYTCLKILQDDYARIKRYIFQIENNQEIIDNWIISHHYQIIDIQDVKDRTFNYLIYLVEK